jgi:Spy/CpxP family protein refolding chaperone
LFILSLALNLCFIGGAVWVRSEAWHVTMTPADRFQMVAQQLSLDADQRAAFDRFIRQMRMRARHMRETSEPLFEEIWDELAKPKPDDAQIDKDIDEANANRHSFQVDSSHALRTFLTTLTPEQRDRFVQLARNRQNKDVPPLLRMLIP